VAIVHDYLNQCGGAERVALELAKIWPGAPIYTSLYRPNSTFDEFAELDVRPTALDHVPVDGGFRALAPLYPLAFRSLGTLDHDLVISSSSGWAHGVRTGPDTVHIVYCHTPARWLHRPHEHLGRSLGPALLAPLAGPLRRWDEAAAERADIYVATCENVRRRVSHIYGRGAHVIHPPVDVERFAPRPRGERLLVVSRLLPYKRVELVVRAAAKAGLGLDVVGEGPSLRALKLAASPDTAFHGRVDETTLIDLMQGCRALCVAATEDFGIAPLEALAAGKPVVAYAAGGVLETLQDGVTAAFFDQLSVDAVVDAIARVDEIRTSPLELAAAAARFSARAFRRRFHAFARDALAAR
jgi:glycosyltransferase involved in cell wall biosynthesis